MELLYLLAGILAPIQAALILWFVIGFTKWNAEWIWHMGDLKSDERFMLLLAWSFFTLISLIVNTQIVHSSFKKD